MASGGDRVLRHADELTTAFVATQSSRPEARDDWVVEGVAGWQSGGKTKAVAHVTLAEQLRIGFVGA